MQFGTLKLPHFILVTKQGLEYYEVIQENNYDLLAKPAARQQTRQRLKDELTRLITLVRLSDNDSHK